MRQLKQEQRNIPEEIWIITFGKGALAEYILPSVTSLVVDQYLVGRHILKIAQILYRNHAVSTLSCTLKADLIPAETTNNIPFSHRTYKQTVPIIEHSNRPDFYQDPVISELNNLERLFANILPRDISLLQGLLGNRTYAQIAEDLELSENTIKYRIKRMMRLTEVKNRDALLALLLRFFGSNWDKS